MATRQYFSDDCTVFTIGGSSILTEIGSGSIKGNQEEVENNALKDAYSYRKVLRKGVEVTLELASDSDCAVDIFSLWNAGAAVACVITTDKWTFSGDFTLTDPTLELSDAMRESVTLRNEGAVTIT